MQACRTFLRTAVPRAALRSSLAINHVTPVVYIQQRNMNFIKDAFTKITTKTVEGSKEKQFSKMMDLMVTNQKWTLRPWKEVMEDQLKSWLLYIPGMSSSKEVDELKGLKEMLDAMNDKELDEPDSIDGKARERIALKSGKPIESVRTLLFLHKQSRVVHQWVLLKKSLNEPLPVNDYELQRMLAEDTRVRSFSKTVMNPTGKKTGRSRRLF